MININGKLAIILIDLGLWFISVLITTKVVSSNPVHGEEY
jgi:hypothetical protein